MTPTDRTTASILATNRVITELHEAKCKLERDLNQAQDELAKERERIAGCERQLAVIADMCTVDGEDPASNPVEAARRMSEAYERRGERIGELEQALDPHGDGCCALHGDAPHGKEAEELRAGIEALIAGLNPGWLELELQKLLDRVNARDSLAHVRANDALADAERQLGEERLRADQLERDLKAKDEEITELTEIHRKAATDAEERAQAIVEWQSATGHATPEAYREDVASMPMAAYLKVGDEPHPAEAELERLTEKLDADGKQADLLMQAIEENGRLRAELARVKAELEATKRHHEAIMAAIIALLPKRNDVIPLPIIEHIGLLVQDKEAAEVENARLRATVERVRALPAKWHDYRGVELELALAEGGDDAKG